MTDTESVLPPRVDWHGNERPASVMETDHATATAARIRSEVTEVRTAAERLAGGTPFEDAVADFLTVQAMMLERAGATARRADSLDAGEDTRETPGMFATPARSALLIARAYNEQKD